MSQAATKSGIPLSPLDVARAQLRTACRLYFESLDPISTHSLASNAHEIVVDLKKKHPSMPQAIQEIMIDKFGNGGTKKRQSIWKMIHQSKNYFKHAGRIADSIVFDPRETDMMLFDACRFYLHVSKAQLPIELMIFVFWFCIQNPDFFRDSKLKDHITEMGGLVGHYPRQEFYEGVIEHWDSDAVRGMVAIATGIHQSPPTRRSYP